MDSVDPFIAKYCYRFKSQCWSLACFFTCSDPQITSCVTPADFLTFSIATISIQVLADHLSTSMVVLEPTNKRAAAQHYNPFGHSSSAYKAFLVRVVHSAWKGLTWEREMKLFWFLAFNVSAVSVFGHEIRRVVDLWYWCFYTHMYSHMKIAFAS